MPLPLSGNHGSWFQHTQYSWLRKSRIAEPRTIQDLSPRVLAVLDGSYSIGNSQIAVPFCKSPMSPETPMSRTPMNSWLLHYTLWLKPRTTSWDLTVDEISLVASANPDRYLLSSNISWGWLSAPSRTCLLLCLHLQTLFKPSSTQIPVLSGNDATKVLNLLSFLSLIPSEVSARTPCGNHSTTSQVLNPSDSAHFLQQQSSKSFCSD